MSRKLLMIICAVVILIVVVVSGNFGIGLRRPAGDTAMSDYWQRHSMETVPMASFARDSIPVTGAVAVDLTDYAARHPELSLPASEFIRADE